MSEKTRHRGQHRLGERSLAICCSTEHTLSTCRDSTGPACNMYSMFGSSYVPSHLTVYLLLIGRHRLLKTLCDTGLETIGYHRVHLAETYIDWHMFVLIMMMTDNPWSVIDKCCVLRPMEEVCFCTKMRFSGMANKVTAQQRIHLEGRLSHPLALLALAITAA